MSTAASNRLIPAVQAALILPEAAQLLTLVLGDGGEGVGRQVAQMLAAGAAVATRCRDHQVPHPRHGQGRGGARAQLRSQHARGTRASGGRLASALRGADAQVCKCDCEALARHQVRSLPSDPALRLQPTYRHRRGTGLGSALPRPPAPPPCRPRPPAHRAPRPPLGSDSCCRCSASWQHAAEPPERSP